MAGSISLYDTDCLFASSCSIVLKGKESRNGKVKEPEKLTPTSDVINVYIFSP